MSGFAPDHAGADVCVSPNFGPRRDDARADMILIHYTGMQSGKAAQAWLCNGTSNVSSHYLVHEDGAIVQMVRERDRAWHAGKSSWRAETDINSHSIGIEIVNPGHTLDYPDFADVQIEAVIRLCRGIMSRHAIFPERVLAHSDVAPGRKIDPGEKFPWARLHRCGVGHWVAPVLVGPGECLVFGDCGEVVERLQSMLAFYGYGVVITGFYDAGTKTVVEAFQRHFRPSLVDGNADSSTRETLRAILAALP